MVIESVVELLVEGGRDKIVICFDEENLNFFKNETGNYKLQYVEYGDAILSYCRKKNYFIEYLTDKDGQNKRFEIDKTRECKWKDETK